MTTNIPVEAKTILHEAQLLFQQQGFRQTTLTEIADASHLALDSVTADYCCKEKIALALYKDLNDDLLRTLDSVPSGKFAERYHHVMTERVQNYDNNAGAISALFANAMLPDSDIEPDDISTGTQDTLYVAFADLIRSSDDAPASEDDVDKLTMLLYTFHFLVTVFWLYDRTPKKQATAHLLDFLYDLFKLMRPMMVMPLFTKAMTKLAQIMMLVFGGAKLVED